jgi:hypothetical protein
MSRAAVMAYVKTRCESIEGISVVYRGKPGGVSPHTFAPYIWLSAQEINPTRLTFGDTGEVDESWVINIHVVIGAPDMDDEIAQELALVFGDRLRYLFYTDSTLGGTAWHAELGGGTNNLETYETNQDPDIELIYPLTVTEHVLANAAAS